jgi:RND family efflux transporter MFP subunit
LIVAVTATLTLILGAGGASLVYQQQIIPAITAKMKNQGGGSGGGPPGGGPPPARVRVAEIRQQMVKPRFDVVGRLEELERTTVAAEVSGKLTAVPVEAGDQVKADETVLARVDEVWSQLELEAAKADVAAAEATLDQSRRDLQQLEQLLKANSAQPKEVADQRAQVKANQAQLDAAIARRKRAEERVNRLVVTAPFDGVVVDKQAEVGQWVEPGSAVVEIISRGQIDAVLNVPEKHINTVSPGNEVPVLVEPLNRRVVGKVVAINPSGNNPARTFPVEVRLSDEGGRLKPGMSVTGQLPLAEKAQRLTVPRSAVSFGPQGAAIWLASGGNRATAGGAGGSGGNSGGGGDGPSGGGSPSNEGAQQQGKAGPMPSAKRLDVEVLFGIEDDYVVQPVGQPRQSELEAGRRVVIEGWERLAPGQALKIVGTGEPEGAEQVDNSPALGGDETVETSDAG